MGRAGRAYLGQAALRSRGGVIEMFSNLEMGGGEDAEEDLWFIGKMSGWVRQIVVDR